MSGYLIIDQLLRASPAVLELVPPERIKAGRLPAGVPLPALLIRTVSSVDRQALKRKGEVRVTDRVSVTVRASDRKTQVLLIRLVRRACAGVTGTIAGFAAVSVLTAGTGPDVDGPNDSFEQAQDFRVGFNEPA